MKLIILISLFIVCCLAYPAEKHPPKGDFTMDRCVDCDDDKSSKEATHSEKSDDDSGKDKHGAAHVASDDADKDKMDHLSDREKELEDKD